MSTASPASRTKIAIVGDAEQALRRLGDWRAIDAQADVTVHHLPLRGAALVNAISALLENGAQPAGKKKPR